MDTFTEKVARRLWLNQMLSWCIRGSVGGTSYTRDEIISFIKADEAAEVIPERDKILQMLENYTPTDKIEVFIRTALSVGRI